MNDHILIVEFVNHPCLPYKGFSEVVIAQTFDLIYASAKQGVGCDVLDGIFKFLIDLIPD